MSNQTLTFSAGGCRWRLRKICGETLPFPGGERALVTGLLFESDNDRPRFLPLNEEVMPSDEEFSRSSVDDLARYLGWATVLADVA